MSKSEKHLESLELTVVKSLKAPTCDQCGDLMPLNQVDDSDPAVGYHDTLYLCDGCLCKINGGWR